MRFIASRSLLGLMAAAIAGGSILHAQAPSAVRAGTPAHVATAAHRESQKTRLLATYGQMPLHFERNEGQVDAKVRFLARGSGYTLFLSSSEAVLALKGAVLRLELVGANARPTVAGGDELPGKSNYLIGNDPAKWRTNVPTYAKVRYGSIYPGVDLVYYGNQRQLEYDFVVAPGADPRLIQLGFEGARRVDIDAAGDLILAVAGGDVRQQRPIVYQEVDGARKQIAGRYVMTGERQVGFDVGTYDASRPLVIDPVLVYSTFLGGSADDSAAGIAVDADGSAYVTGETLSLNFPTTLGAYDETAISPAGTVDAFVSKLSPDGSTLLYSTYLGGPNDDEGRAIAIHVDGVGDRYVYVTGLAQTGFPTTGGAFQPVKGAGTTSDAFVAKLDDTGSILLYSTFLGGGGADEGHGIAVDGLGNAYVTGQTLSTAPTPFPTAPTPGAFDTSRGGASDAFVAKLNPAGAGVADLVYSTYLGGSLAENGNGIAVDGPGNAYVVGQTFSFNATVPASTFPTTPGAFQTVRGGASDAFVTKVNLTGTGLAYSTYLGGAGNSENGFGIAVDGTGNAYVTGQTLSVDFPTTPGAYDLSRGGNNDAFVTRLNPAGLGPLDLVYSTYLGGGGSETGFGIAVDGAGYVHVTGQTASTDFPATPGADSSRGGTNDAFVTTLNPAGSGLADLVYSTYLGGGSTESGNGIAVGLDGSVYVAGSTSSIGATPFPAIAGSYDTTHNGGVDAFVTKLGTLVVTLTLDPPSALNPVNSQHCVTATVRDELGNGVQGMTVHFTVSGAVSASGTRTTNASGNTIPAFCYTGPAFPGDDVITAWPDADADGVQDAAEPTATATKTWETAATTTTLTSSPNPSVVGQNVTFTATVTAAGSGVPTGTVTFMDGVTELDEVTLDSSGQAILDYADLNAGPHTITATYNGNYETSSDSILQTVLAADTTTTLSSSVNPSMFGQVVTFIATVTPVAPGAGTVIGTVTFSDGGAPLATVRLNASGEARFAASSLAVGSHTITADYNGDGNFNTSSAAPITQTVNAGTTSTSITSTPNPSTFGQNVTLSAHVTPLAPAARTLAFAPPVSYTAGASTFAAASGDFNGDGWMDLAVTNIATDTVGILLGDGAGGFGSPTLFAVGDGPVYVVAADLDGDDILDLVTANEASNNASVLRGNGDGTFDPAVTVLSGTDPHGVAVGDFNGDGDLDLAIANAGSNTVSLRFGDGMLGFGAGPNFLVGSRPLQVVTADFNHDGSLDFATVNIDASSVTIKLNNGSGGFPAIMTALMAPLGSGSLALVVADLNADGELDIATANRDSGNVTVRLGSFTGNPSCPAECFGNVTSFALGASPDGDPVRPEFMVGGDFNGDGYADLAVTDSNHSLVTILTGTGIGMFGAPVTFDDGVPPYPFADDAAGRRIVAADLNGDGMLDMAFPTLLGSDVKILLNTGFGPTGSVQFKADGVAIGGPVALVNGKASVSTSTLTVGTHPLTAEYTSDNANYGASTGTTDHVVNKSETATTVTSSVSPSVYGQPVTFTATVSAVAPGAGMPSGSVQFRDNGTAMGAPAALTGGVATVATAALTVGSHTITAEYLGDISFDVSTGAVTQTVDKAETSTSVTSSVNPSVFGQPVTFTATVSPVAPGAGTPSGSVQFSDNGTPMGPPVALDAAGAATIDTATLAVGSHTITAEYLGDDNFDVSTGAVIQTVDKADTSTSVTSSVDPSVFGQPVTFTATVSAVAPGDGTPSGLVQFLDNGTPIGAPVALTGGVATVETAALAVGSHTITAEYLGDGNFEVSEGAVTQTVDKADTSTSVTSSVNPSVFGQPVTFTATVSAVAPGAGTPSGLVQFSDNGTPIGAPVVLIGGVATIETSTLAVGSHTITAEYLGDGNFEVSTGAVTQTVNKANSTTTVTSSVNPSVFGQPVTFTATVSAVAPGSGTPSGLVQFRDNGTAVGAPVVLAGGVATVNTATLTAGSHTITADYLGDGNFEMSAGSVTQTVTQAANPVLSLTKSVDKTTANPGDLLVYTLTYSNTGTGPATGVTIRDVVPAQTTFVSASHGGTNVAGEVRWTIGNVAAGASGSVTLTVRVSSTLTCPPGDDHKGSCTVSVRNQGSIQSIETPSPKSSNTVTTQVTVGSEGTTGRMTGGGTFGTLRVHHGFTLHCDPQQGSNNLEVNWGKGNKFHLERLTSAACSDDPRIAPRPSSASFDTYRGTGAGRYNGAPATAEWTFTDAGEPGSRDTATIVIRNAAGLIVLSASGSISGGNHQAH